MSPYESDVRVSVPLPAGTYTMARELARRFGVDGDLEEVCRRALILMLGDGGERPDPTLVFALSGEVLRPHFDGFRSAMAACEQLAKHGLYVSPHRGANRWILRRGEKVLDGDNSFPLLVLRARGYMKEAL